MPPFPAPAGAAAHPGDGELATAAHLALTDLHARLREHYEGPWDVERFAVPADVTWETVTGHYARALGAEWAADARYGDRMGYRARVWESGGRAVAIGLTPARTGPTHTLTVLTPTGENG